MQKPDGYDEPHVECDCGDIVADMGANVRCDSCGDTLPTGRDEWVKPDGSEYPQEWAYYSETNDAG
jgi:hypothetical protein